MTISKWKPSSSISSFFEYDMDIPSMFSRNYSLSGFNLYENEKQVIAEMVMPGVHEDSIDVSVDGKMVF